MSIALWIVEALEWVFPVAFPASRDVRSPAETAMKLIALPFVFASCLGIGWAVFLDSQQHADSELPSSTRNEVAVEVNRPAKQDIAEVLELVGSLEAGRDVEIRSRVSGQIRKLSVDIGDRIDSGQVLVELDDSEEREGVRQAEAALNVAQAAEAAQKLRVDAARRDRDRLRELGKKGVSTPQQREAAESTLAIAGAELKLAVSKAAQVDLEIQRSRLAMAERQIRSPLGGHVASRSVQAGDLAKPDVGLLRIIDLSTVRTSVHVGEGDYRRLREQQVAEVSVDTFPDRVFVGRVERLAPILDPETRTAVVYIAVENPQGFLKPGMHARVRVVLDRREQVCVVPLAAIVDSERGPTLFVVADNGSTLNQVQVKLGVVEGSVVEIISGVRNDDRVVTLGSHLVRDGQDVQLVEENTLPAD